MNVIYVKITMLTFKTWISRAIFQQPLMYMNEKARVLLTPISRLSSYRRSYRSRIFRLQFWSASMSSQLLPRSSFKKQKKCTFHTRKKKKKKTDVKRGETFMLKRLLTFQARFLLSAASCKIKKARTFFDRANISTHVASLQLRQAKLLETKKKLTFQARLI